ncbi:homocysteine S-methyltransferase family protein [Microbacteriaceae bacterium VKM Ac-2855]|nr:homocysteine S-methyltransferase family protein [Microbacteriaceae bacterium VKM Ac-2855]
MTTAARYRNDLPQLSDPRVFLTDGGLETTLIFLHGIELPQFAACELLRSDEGRTRLRAYYESFLRLAQRDGFGFTLDTPTWRANPDWTERLGYDDETFDAVNRAGVALAAALRAEYDRPETPVVIGATLGPRGDGYVLSERQTVSEAREYHRRQLALLAETEVDFAAVLTLGYSDEATGVVLAAGDVGLPIVISFTVETDGRLPSGETLAEAIETVDAATDAAAAYFMVNCAHPTHLPDELPHRVRGYRANASRLSHAELDASDTLDAGDPADLAARMVGLRQRMPQLNVLGGCCGSDIRHIAALADHLA